MDDPGPFDPEAVGGAGAQTDGAADRDQEEPAAPASAVICSAMRSIRMERRLTATEVARRMGMPTRSYEHMEAGTGRLTYERITAFAEATDSDPIALMATLSSGSSAFALRCMDNKLMTIMMIAMIELDEELGDDVAYLDAQTLVGGFTRLARDFAQHVRKRETFAEEWLRRGAGRLSGRTEPAAPRKRR